MKEPFQSSFETTLYRALAAHQRGDTEAVHAVYNLLVDGRNRPIPDGALLALQEILKIPKEDIQVAATVALSSMKERAVGAVEALKQLALSDEGNAANAAISAIGGIPGQRSVTALLDILEACQDRANTDKRWFAVQACAALSAYFSGHVTRLEEALRFVDQDELMSCKPTLDKIRLNAREELSASLGSIQLPEQVDIERARTMYRNGTFEGALPSR